MSKSNYRDLIVWQKARELAVDVYRATQTFPQVEMFGLTQQSRRAAISVICNIAEGHGRRSTRDVLKFLIIARGSVLEIETQIVIATDLEYIDAARADELVREALDVVKLLNGLIRHYERTLT